MLPKSNICQFIICLFFITGMMILHPAGVFSETGDSNSQEKEVDPDTALYLEYLERIEDFSVPMKIRILRRFVELHPDNRHVPEIKEMIREYERITGPLDTRELRRLPAPEPKIPEVPPVEEELPALKPAPSPPAPGAPPPKPTVPPVQTVRSYPGDIKADPAYQKGFQQGFQKGYKKGKSQKFGAGVGTGILGTIIAEILLVILIVAAD